MIKVVLRSVIAGLIVLACLAVYGTFRPQSAFSAFAPCTVASVACFYKMVDSAGVNVASVNASGQMAIQQLPTTLTTGSNWTSATTVNTTQTIYSGTNVKVVLVQVDVTSTVTGGAITFQLSYDGTNYVAPSASQVLDPTSAVMTQLSLPYTLVASTNKPFLILMRGAQSLQLKLSTAITGTATLTPYFTLLPDINFNEVLQPALYIDPCQTAAKTYKPVSITANTQIVTGASGKQTYICSVNLGPIPAATNVALVEGSGTTCATSTLGMAGGNTAATGWNFAANGGIAHGDGSSSVAGTATLANNVCLFVSAANQVSGVITWVQK